MILFLYRILLILLTGLCAASLWAGDKPTLLLAKVYHPGIELSHYLVSEKLDGVRGYWDGKQLISRQGNRFAAPAWFTEGFPEAPLDGELWIGRNRFEEVSGIVRRKTPHQNWRRVRFMVFDLPGSNRPFGERYRALRKQVAESESAYLKAVEQRRISDHPTLMAELDQVVKLGGEGLMLHRIDSLYRGGRSDDLLKVKPFADAEARVIAHLPGKGKYTGMMGSLLVETPEGTRFRIGSGFSDRQRRSPPPIGSTITYRYRSVTRKAVPRFASFLRIREEI